MYYPLTVRDFLDRAEHLYPDRVAIVDEPDQPAPSLGAAHLPRGRRAGPCPGGPARRPGRARRRPGGGDLAELRAAVHLVLRRFGVGPRSSCRSTSGWPSPRSSTSSATAAPRSSTPTRRPSTCSTASTSSTSSSWARTTRCSCTASSRRPWADPDEAATATINYTSGTTARPKGVQLTHRNLWLNATVFGMHTTITDRDVYLHTLPMFHCNGWGMPYAHDRDRRQADRDPPDRRCRDPAPRREHGVTMMCAAPAVVNAALDAAATWDGPIPGRDRVRVVVCRRAPADAHDRAGPHRPGLGVLPDLRPDRDRRRC